MSEDDKPIFPRKDNQEEVERQRILDEARGRLEAAYEQERTCYKCGSRVPPNIKFCLNCGVLVSEERAEPVFNEIGPPPVQMMYGPPPIPIGNNKILLIIGGLVFILALVGGIIIAILLFGSTGK